MNDQSQKPLLGNHQKCWMWGRNVVLETLRAGRWEILELHLADRLSAEAIREASALAEGLGVPVEIEPGKTLERKCHAPDHQGYLAKMVEFPYACAKDALQAASSPALFLVMDGIHDPHNFGAMIRSADAFGVDSVWIGADGQTGVTSQAARSSAGAVNRLPIVRAEKLLPSIVEIKSHGARMIAASEKAGREIGEVVFTHPCAIVIGNEGRGISPGVLAQCDEEARIPQRDSVGSLNAAAAAAVILYEAARQRSRTIG